MMDGDLSRLYYERDNQRNPKNITGGWMEVKSMAKSYKGRLQSTCNDKMKVSGPSFRSYSKFHLYNISLQELQITYIIKIFDNAYDIITNLQSWTPAGEQEKF